MTTELQPTFELAVMREENRPLFTRDDPGRRRNVAWETIAKETTLVVAEQLPDPIDRRDLIRMPVVIAIQQSQEIGAVHRDKLAAGPARTQKGSPKPAEKLNPSSENPKSARNSAARSTVARALTP